MIGSSKTLTRESPRSTPRFGCSRHSCRSFHLVSDRFYYRFQKSAGSSDLHQCNGPCLHGSKKPQWSFSHQHGLWSNGCRSSKKGNPLHLRPYLHSGRPGSSGRRTVRRNNGRTPSCNFSANNFIHCLTRRRPKHYSMWYYGGYARFGYFRMQNSG